MAEQVAELEDELDPILFINKMYFQRRQMVFLTTRLGSLVVFELGTRNEVVAKITLNSAVNCLGSL